MKKLLVLLILIATLAVAGCAEYNNNNSEDDLLPNETVVLFRDSFESNDADMCYSLMSKEYKKENDAYAFLQTIDGYKNDEALQYEFIGVKDFTVVEDVASVDIEYNKKEDVFGYSWETNKEKKIELVKENGGWKFKEFPLELI
ncbi:hypothetical protein [uncultured Methanolobus sp.]|uniref:hypothetical protein n=1 Tax=uncultured Methanolobus sp. TaxID=218300 RepID=UPI002AABF8A8|nr:hypothetical protein [uncultured Methanolobus sp.]